MSDRTIFESNKRRIVEQNLINLRKSLIEERRNLRAHFLYGLSENKQARVREIEAKIDELDRDIYSNRGI